ncbi:MAG: cell filamentation protein, partial [Clostridia bacterium]|nr:cell filamentation protein [Clostridia bacterium]
ERKQDIDERKQDIGERKQDIEPFFPYADLLKAANGNETTSRNTQHLFNVFGFQTVFGRKDVCAVTGLTPSPASTLLHKLLSAGVITPVSGKGKGKYQFRKC